MKDKAILYMFAVLYVLLTTFYGGELFWSVLLISGCTYFLIALLMKDILANRIEVSKVPIALLGASLILTPIIQLLLLTSSDLSLPLNVSDAMNAEPIKHKEPGVLSPSQAPNFTALELLKNIFYTSIFVTALYLFNRHKNIIAAVKMITYTVAFISTISLLSHISNSNVLDAFLLPPWDVYGKSSIHGTLSYKNHFAALLVVATPLSFGLTVRDITKSGHRNKQGKLGQVLNFVLSRGGLHMVCSVLMLITLILNSSRAANAALLFSTVMVFVLYVHLLPKKETIELIKKAIVGSFVILIALSVTGIGDNLISRYQNASENGRDHLREATLNIIKKYPILGTGAGTYPEIQQQYKSSQLNGSIMWQRAHNDYLEHIATYGLISFVLLASSIIIFLHIIIKKLKVKRPQPILLASLCSLIGLLVHSMADFNFQLPIIPVNFFIIMAIALKIQTTQTKE